MNANVSALGRRQSETRSSHGRLSWWDRRRRSLAWRAAPGESPDPYRVWLSEVLLQQTTAQAATPYYQAFIAKWPRVEDLAAAPGEAVISAFAGLGYYSRALNLHACAKEIARRGGRFPSEEADLRVAPRRRRLYRGGDRGDRLWTPDSSGRRQYRPHPGAAPRARRADRRARGEIASAARALAPSHRAGDFAQALMDIGATVCRPRKPDCGLCPLAQDCAAPDRRARGLPASRRRRPSRGARARCFSPGALTAHSSLAAARRMAFLLRPSNCRERRGAAENQRGSLRVPLPCRAVAASARRRRAGLHPLRSQAYRLRGGFRRRRSGRPFLGGAATRSARRGSRT